LPSCFFKVPAYFNFLGVAFFLATFFGAVFFFTAPTFLGAAFFTLICANACFKVQLVFFIYSIALLKFYIAIFCAELIIIFLI